MGSLESSASAGAPNAKSNPTVTAVVTDLIMFRPLFEVRRFRGSWRVLPTTDGAAAAPRPDPRLPQNSPARQYNFAVVLRCWVNRPGDAEVCGRYRREHPLGSERTSKPRLVLPEGDEPQGIEAGDQKGASEIALAVVVRGAEPPAQLPAHRWQDQA